MFFSFLKRLLFGRKLDSTSTKYFYSSLKHIKILTPQEQIIQYDIVYHKILQKLGYTGSFGDILKRNPKEISNIQQIWSLHKLRNTLVHELHPSKENLVQQAILYEQSIQKLLQKVGV